MRRWAALATALALLAAPASAHRGRSTLSVVEIDAATGEVVVTHRMAAHDVEPALVDLAPDAQPSLDDPDALAALIEHGESAFVLADAGGRVTLTHRGTELAGDDVRLIYVGRLVAPGRTITVDSNLFVESHRDEENQVNVRRGKVTRTVLFRRGTVPKQVVFD